MSTYQDGFEVPALPINPRPRALLLHAARSLDLSHPLGDDGERDFDPNEAIIGGINFCGGNVCIDVDVDENIWCADSAPPWADEGFDFPDADGSVWGSFSIITAEQAPARFNEAWLIQRATERLEAKLSAKLAYELLTGEMSGNSSLRSSTVVAVDTPVDRDDLEYVLEDILARWEDVEFTVHAPPGIFSLLVQEGTVEQDLALDPEGNPLADPNPTLFRTAAGHVVVGDAGYDGSLGPVDPDNPGTPENPNYVATDNGGAWLYATAGRPALWLGPARRAGSLEPFHNRETYVTERSAVIAFEPCATVAIEVEVPTYVTKEAGS